VGDSDPRVHPYPLLTLKGKKVTQLACGDAFVVALGNKVKREIPGLNLDRRSSKEAKRKKRSSGSVKCGKRKESLTKCGSSPHSQSGIKFFKRISKGSIGD